MRMAFEYPPCALALCDGSGVLVTTDPFDGTTLTRCPCGAPMEPPAEVAERLDRVIDAEVRARRRAQELIHRSYNGGAR